MRFERGGQSAALDIALCSETCRGRQVTPIHGRRCAWVGPSVDRDHIHPGRLPRRRHPDALSGPAAACSAADAPDFEAGDVLEDPIAGHQLQVQRHRRRRDPAIGLVDLLRERMAGTALLGP